MYYMFRIPYGDYGLRRTVSPWSDAWMGADVLRDEGWTHGTVVGVEPNGLIIDFGCEGMRRQRVNFGEAFTASNYGQRWGEDFEAGCAVEVLLREGPQSPWVWRPGTMLAADIPEKQCALMALVKVEISGVGRHECQMVESTQVRPPPSAADLRSRVIREDQFIIRAYQLVDLAEQLYPLNSMRPVVDDSRCLDMAPFSVMTGQLFILQRTNWTPTRLESEIRHVYTGLKHIMEERARALLVEQKWGECLPLGLDAGEESAAGSEWTMHNVHWDVLTEMVTYLDTSQRVLLRRVCRAFDELLTGTLSTDIRITFRECRVIREARSVIAMYPLAATLLQCLSARSRCITITHGGEYAETVSDLVLIVRTLGQVDDLGVGTTGPDVLLVAGNCDIGVECFTFWQSADLLAVAMPGSRCKLLLKHCTMSYSYPGVLFSGAVRHSLVWEDLCRLVERQLPTFDVQRTSEWVALATQGQVSDNRWLIATVLNEFTTPDPRPSNPYVGYKWTADNVAGVDVSNLSHITLHELSGHVPPPSVFDQLPFAQFLQFHLASDI